MPDNVAEALRRRTDVHALPAERIDGKSIEVVRVNAAAPERFHERDPVTEGIVWNDIEVGGDDAAQVFPKRDIDRWNVVQRAD